LREAVANDASYNGKCCLTASDGTNCATEVANIASGTSLALTYVSGTNSLETLIGQCQYNTAVCSATGGNHDSSSQVKIIDTIGDTGATLKMTGAYKKDKDQCTWVVKVECGAPGIRMTDTSVSTAAQMVVSFTEYTNEFLKKYSVTLEGTSPTNAWIPAA